MYSRLGAIVARYWFGILLGWVALVGGVRWLTPRWDAVTRDGDFAYLPEGMTSVRGQSLQEAAFPESLAKSEVVFVLARGDGALGDVDYATADKVVALAERLRDEFAAAEGRPSPILRILSHETEVVGENLLTSPVGRDGQALLVVVQLRTEIMAIGNIELLAKFERGLDAIRRAEDFPAGLTVGLTGSAAVGADWLASAEESISNTEVATVVMVVVILLLVYRAPGLVIVPLLTIFASLLVATGLVAALAQWSAATGYLGFKVFKTTEIFIVVILYGAGTDFCLFLISRYKEELQRGLRPAEAIAQALGRVGGAVAASAMTTVLGLAVMAFCEFGKFRNSGPTIALGLLVALVASLTLAPALLRALGPVVFWPFTKSAAPVGQASRPSSQDDARPTPFGRFWEWLSRLVIARPGLILVVSLLVLSPLAYAGVGVGVTYDLLRELQPSRASVAGTELLRRYFSAGETGPITVLAYAKSGGLDDTPETRRRIERLADWLYDLEYEDTAGRKGQPVGSVRSLVEPLGESTESFGFREALRREAVRAATKGMYLAQAPEYAGRVTRLNLICPFDPFSSESIRFLNQLEGQLQGLSDDPQSEWHGTEFRFLGTTAGIRDLKEVTVRDLLLIQCLVPVAVLLVLVSIIRRPVVSAYLVLSVLFGYLVSMGVTKLVFMGLYGGTYDGLDWKVPMFLFVILVAVGEDYNIYLVTRVVEEQKRLGAVEGLRVALVRTGGIITSCGIIMAGTFASMTTGTLRAIVELGFALSFGVLLDTFVIRTILVPVFLVLWQRRLAARHELQG
jgi:putative drug exporter of the RND superfamily